MNVNNGTADNKKEVTNKNGLRDIVTKNNKLLNIF